MTLLLSCLRHVSKGLTQTISYKTSLPLPILSSSARLTAGISQRGIGDKSESDTNVSAYKAYPEYETPSPFKPQTVPYRAGYKYRYYKGGLLPRPEKYDDKPYKNLPKFDARKRDQWTERKALFGQNDYIDILGDGYVHPSELISAPGWLKGYRGNEFQRIVRRLGFEGEYLKTVKPATYHSLRKQAKYLFKKLNRKRSHSNYWSAGGRMSGRLFKIKR